MAFADGRFTDLNLSTGQRKRLALIVALLEDRPIYAFDEWSAEQDAHFREEFYTRILPSLKARGKTVIAVTHDERYWRLADRVIRLDLGRVAWEHAGSEIREDVVKAFLFPGQGAQRMGMGSGLFDRFPELTRTADAVLGYSIESVCREGPLEKLTRTEITQPAIYVVNALSYLRRVEAGPKPEYLAGHSVAEYVALFAAGSVDFETGLRLVRKRGELMGQATGGGMAAVIGLDADQVAAILERHRLKSLFAANFNTPRQIVISGAKDDVVRAEPLFLAGGASYYKVLTVGGAFHTPFMAAARDRFREFVAGIAFRPPRFR